LAAGWLRRFGRNSFRSAGRFVAAAAAILFAAVSYSWLTLPDVRHLAGGRPDSTSFMRIRDGEARRAGRTPRRVQRWVSINGISAALKRAVLVAEDAGFYGHNGLDLEELRLAIETNLRRGEFARGGSTLTQQLAKNLYLSPSRNPYRKLTELMIARRLEAELTKARIFELYLNLIEWGDGIWGIEAAAQSYFGVSAGGLSPDQSALLAGAIINPRLYSPARPNARLLRRQQIIRARMNMPDPVPPVPVEVIPPLMNPPVIDPVGTGSGS
jgi:monofunctional biosynthetic peptidoglycan transglycosylase